MISNKSEFDFMLNRRGTHSAKWDSVPETALPMWVADMDFRSPKAILEGLREVVDFGNFGYPILDEAYFTTIAQWFRNYHQSKVQEDFILPITSVVSAMQIIIETFSQPHDAIVIQTPVYHRFLDVVRNTAREIIYNPLLPDAQGRYHMDFDQLETLKQKKPKIFLLCSPQNPVGRIWTHNELEKIGQFCIENNILLVVDEMHCDLIFPGEKFISVASLSDDYLQNTMVLNAPSKTFNLAGLRGGHVFVFNEAIKNKMAQRFNICGLSKLNTFFITAAQIGYSRCRSWIETAMEYIEQNRACVEEYFRAQLPDLHLTPSQATYLLWINYQKLNISEDQLTDLLAEKLIVSKGTSFGFNGEGYFRLNVACPLERVKQALAILEETLGAI